MRNLAKTAERVRLEVLESPRTVASDHLLGRLGLNFRAGNPLMDEEKRWHVPLRALIPASPDVIPRREDQLYYRFDSFGEIVLDSSLKVISYPKIAELNSRFQTELSHLFAKVEKMIIDYGTDKWGRIPLIRSFLNPLNAILSQALSLPNISLMQLKQQEYLLYGDLLRKAGFLEESSENPDHLRRSNLLVAIAEKYKDKEGYVNLDETAIEVTSIICSKFYSIIKERVTVFPSYVDTTVAYYVRAARLRRLVPMGVSDLEYSFNVLGRKQQDTRVTFYGKVADLVTAGFLRWYSQGVVIGVDPIFSKVETVGPELETNVHLLKANA